MSLFSNIINSGEASSSDDDDFDRKPLHESSIHSYILSNQKKNDGIPKNDISLPPPPPPPPSLLWSPVPDTPVSAEKKEPPPVAVTYAPIEQPKSAMDEILQYTKVKRRESISNIHTSQHIPENNTNVSLDFDALEGASTGPVDTTAFSYGVETFLSRRYPAASQTPKTASSRKLKASDLSASYSHDTNFRRKIVKASIDTLHEIYSTTEDIGVKIHFVVLNYH